MSNQKKPRSKPKQKTKNAASESPKNTEKKESTKAKTDDKASTRPHEAYARLVGLVQSRGGLSEKHRQELHHKRGLTDETINRARLLSADTPIDSQETKRRQVSEAIAILCKDFSKDELTKAGLLREVEPSKRRPEGGYDIARQLNTGNIIIPYLGKDGEVLGLRSHKFGLSGQGALLFGLDALAIQPKQVVLTEGEFKALALQQCTIPSIATPGVSAFSGKHLGVLVDELMSAEVQELIILFDNEVKNNPALPGYKEDPLKRWDTDYWAIQMAKSVWMKSGHKIQTKIARLPDEWRDEAGGKIDPDGALALGHTADELRQVIASAVPLYSYVETFLRGDAYDEARRVLGWLEAKRSWRSKNPKVKNGHYVWSKVVGEETVEETISNFILEPSHTVIRADGTRERFVDGVQPYNRVTLSLPPKAFTTNKEFRACVTGDHALHWKGNADSYQELAQCLDETIPPLIAKETEGYGRQDSGLWIFGDGMLVPATKRALPLGKFGAVWDGLNGIMPLEDPGMPAPKMGIAETISAPQHFPMPSDICKALCDTYGSIGTALALGWSLACVFSDEIFDKFGFFPLLGLVGLKKGTGKSRLGDLVREQWGGKFNASSKRIDLNIVNPKAMVRTFAKYQSMPVFIDEYRSSLKDNKKDFIRAVYDRSSHVRANVSSDNKTNAADIRACAIVGGEELPDDPALRSRFIEVPFKIGKRGPSHFKMCNKLMAEGRGLVRWTILNSADLVDRVLEDIEAAGEHFSGLVDTERDGGRIAGVYAVPVGVLSALEVALEDSNEFTSSLFDWVAEELPIIQGARAKADHLERFFEGLAILANRPDSSEDVVHTAEGSRKLRAINKRHVVVSRDGKSLVLNFADAFDVFIRNEKQKGQVGTFTRETLEGYLRDAPYVSRGNSRKFGPERKSAKGWNILLEHPSCPESAHELCERLALQDLV